MPSGLWKALPPADGYKEWRLGIPPNQHALVQEWVVFPGASAGRPYDRLPTDRIGYSAETNGFPVSSQYFRSPEEAMDAAEQVLLAGADAIVKALM